MAELHEIQESLARMDELGAGRQGGGSGNRGNDEYVLKQDTTYYARLKGLTNGADAAVA